MAYWLKIWPVLLDGFAVSVSIYALTMIFALPIGMLIGLMADLVKPARKIISVFTWIIRGTQLLLQLYVTMYGLP